MTDKEFTINYKDMTVSALIINDTSFAEGSTNRKLEEIFGRCAYSRASDVSSLIFQGGLNQPLVMGKLKEAFDRGSLNEADVAKIKIQLTAIEEIPLEL